MWERGIVIILGLPNSTEVNQEIDYLYHTFNTKTYARTKRDAYLKIARRVADRCK